MTKLVIAGCGGQTELTTTTRREGEGEDGEVLRVKASGEVMRGDKREKRARGGGETGTISNGNVLGMLARINHQNMLSPNEKQRCRLIFLTAPILTGVSARYHTPRAALHATHRCCRPSCLAPALQLPSFLNSLLSSLCCPFPCFAVDGSKHEHTQPALPSRGPLIDYRQMGSPDHFHLL